MTDQSVPATAYQLAEIAELTDRIRVYNPEHADVIASTIAAIPTIPGGVAAVFIEGLSTYLANYRFAAYVS